MILCIRLLSVTCRSALIQRMGSSASQPTTTTVRYPVLQHRPFRSRSQSFPIAWLEIHRAHRHAARLGGPSWRVQPVVPARCLTKLPGLYRAGPQTPSFSCGTARSLSAATILAPGTIVIVKNTIGGDGPFAYTATGNGVSNFSLTTVSGTASQTFGGLVPGNKGGSRTFTETPIPNQFKLSSLTCASALGTSTITTDLGTGVATVSSLGDGDTVTCTYTNTKVDANIQITPATATNAVGTNHTLTITVTAVGTTLGNGSATASITSGPGSFVGSPTCSYTGGGSTASCTVVITSATSGTTVVSATSSIPLTGAGSATRTTNGTAGNSTPAIFL